MNLEIRAKRKDDDTWVYGYYFCQEKPDGQKEHFIIRDSYCTYNGERTIIKTEIKEDTIGLKTYLDDIYGNKIYAGDILLSEKYRLMSVVYMSESGVRYCDAYDYREEPFHYIRHKEFSEDITECILGKYKIIGNIHENKEMIGRNTYDWLESQYGEDFYDDVLTEKGF